MSIRLIWMIWRNIKSLFFLLVIVTSTQAQNLSNIPGAFSETGFGVRPSGMGQAYTAISDDAHAFLTNPAGLMMGLRPSFTANYAKLFGIVPSGYFGMLYPLSKNYSLGGGFLFLGDDALMENTLGVSLAASFENVPIRGNELYFDQMSFGITVKSNWASFGNNPDGGQNQVTGSGAGYSVDLGYLLLVNEKLRLGLMLRDLINDFHWNSSVSGEYQEDVPATLRFGVAYALNGVTVAFDLRKNLHDDTSNRAHFGAEKIFWETLTLRAGFSNNLGTADLNRRWTFGFSLLRGVFEKYTVGINSAYRVGNIENLFQFGLDFSWGEPKPMPPEGRVH